MMPRADPHDTCPQCGQPKLRGSKVCVACHYRRNVSSVGTLRARGRAEAMVGLLKATRPAKPPLSPVDRKAPYEPAGGFERALDLETGLPVKVKVGPSTAVFVQCSKRPEGQAHRYRLDQANHGVCQDCGTERDWPRPTWDAGWGDVEALTWE